MKNLFYLSTFAVAIIALIGFSNHDAYATSYTAVISGDWNNPSTWGGTVPGPSDNVIIPSAITVTIPIGYTVTVSSGGTIDNNYGTIINDGTIYNNGGIITNNSGTINNYGIINNSGGTINNESTTTPGIIVNFTGIINNNSGGTIVNQGGSLIQNNTGGTVTNSNTITNYGTIRNFGIHITNSGFIHNLTGTIENTLGGSIANSGTILNTSGTITNLGTITNSGILNNPSGIITNSGKITNTHTGAINTQLGSTITNSGLVDNDGVITNLGTIANPGIIHNFCDGTMNNSGTLTGNHVIYSICKIVFTSGTGQTLNTGQVSSVITVQLQHTGSTPVNAVTGGVLINLSTTSSGGQFSLLQSPFTPITTITIHSGSDSATLYYRDATVGSPTITASSSTLTSAITTFTVGAPPSPSGQADLAWSSTAVNFAASTPQPFVPGQLIIVRASYSNIGSSSAIGFVNSYTLKDPNGHVISSGITDVGNSLNPGASSATGTSYIPSSGAIPGTYTITMTLDSGNAITESNENNNVITSTFTVGAPPPTTASISLNPTSVSAGNQVVITGTNFTPSNIVTVYFDGANIATSGAPVDSSGTIIISTGVPSSATAGTHTILVSDTSGKSASATITVNVISTNNCLIPNQIFLKFGSYGSADGQFIYPEGVAVDASCNIYVADSGNNRIQEFNSAGIFLSKFGSVGMGDGQFRLPNGIALDSSGNIYVVDSRNNRIQEFNSAGIFLSKFGSQCTLSTNVGCIDPDGAGPLDLGDGQFNYPQGIALDNSGNIYVADGFNNRIQEFNSAGIFLSKFGSQCTLSTNVGCIDPDGAGPLDLGDGQFDTPLGIAIDSSGNIYVADSGNHRIQEFNSAGIFLSKFGSVGMGDGQFIYPEGVAVDASRNIYVADTVNHRIQEFNSAGIFLSKLGSRGTGNGQFDTPYGISLSVHRDIYVADTYNSRIQTFVQPATITSTGAVQFDPSSGVFTSLTAVSQSSLSPAPPAGTYPFGFFNWTISGLTLGQTVQIKIIYPSDPGTSYLKLINGVWVTIPATVTANSDGTFTVTLTLTDGGTGDSDGLANRQISDPGGMGLLSALPLTTTSETSLEQMYAISITITVIVITGGIGVWTIVRRK